jgi:hypothetical protein
MTVRTPIQFKPGVVRAGSEAEMTGNWYEAHLIRWVGGVMRPVDGWERIKPLEPFTAFDGMIRCMHVWTTLDGISRIAIMTENKLYTSTIAGDITDISPVVPLTPPDYALIGGFGDEQYFGDVMHDPYGGYGTPRGPKSNVELQANAPMWTLDNFGDKLLACSSVDGRLLSWDPNTVGAVAERVKNGDAGEMSPITRTFVVTPERHVMLFQRDTYFNSFCWCSQEDLEDWDFAAVDNSASFYDIEPSAQFLCAATTRTGVIAFTVKGAYLITYLGTPYFYSYHFLGAYNAPVCGDALQQLANMTMWYASDGFWGFDGQTIAPVKCPLLDYVQDNIDQRWKYFRMAAVYLGVQSEVWFFFPSPGQQENDLFVSYNFDEKWWSMGKLGRTCGVTGSALSYPLMSDGAYVYQHEKGRFYGDIDLPYAQTAAINLMAGGKRATIRQGIADTRAPAADVQFLIAARKARILDSTNIVDFQSNRVVRKDGGKVDFRVTGRDIVIRIQTLRNGAEPWTFGQFLAKVIPRGQR